MRLLDDWLTALRHLIRIACGVFLDFLSLVALAFRSRSAVAAENLFLRKQLALFQERKTKDPSQRWLTLVCNHAQAIVACDFFVVVTARFGILYVFLLMELGRRRILHVNVTDHPSAEWTQQQLREALPGEHPFRFLIHDRDSIFSQELDEAVPAMDVRVLRTPFRAPQANARCERLIGTIRRECLDFLISLGQRHLKDIVNRWLRHYNHGRVHMPLGQAIPVPLHPSPPRSDHRHHIPRGHRVHCKPVLGGLYHEYWLEKIAA